MRELIGPCASCGKNVYCEDGFFDGVQEAGKLLCNECASKHVESENKKDND
ncbi:MAG TPA: hypothetical protein VK091_07460 [Virgibacillus sp.]|nr:hypothetical protein [Virgibacillus sp.]